MSKRTSDFIDKINTMCSRVNIIVKEEPKIESEELLSKVVLIDNDCVNNTLVSLEEDTTKTIVIGNNRTKEVDELLEQFKEFESTVDLRNPNFEVEPYIITLIDRYVTPKTSKNSKGKKKKSWEKSKYQ